MPLELKFLCIKPIYYNGDWHIIADSPKPEKYGSMYSYSFSFNSGTREFIGIVFIAVYAEQAVKSFCTNLLFLITSGSDLIWIYQLTLF